MMSSGNEPDPSRQLSSHDLVAETAAYFKQSWKLLALTDLVYKLIAFIVLTPLVGALFRVLIALSGNSVLSDMDILFFFLGPLGWMCFILVGALSLGIVALEQASLMGVIAAGGGSGRFSLLETLHFAWRNGWDVIQVTARMVALTLLTIAPFLVVVGVVYFALLTQHDINFYLKEKPPVFLAAVAMAGTAVAVLAAVLVRFFTSWFFALPLVLFEGVRPGKALGVSKKRAEGRRRTLLIWIVGWVAATSMLSAVATGAVGMLAHLLIPDAPGSIRFLVVAVGLILAVLGAVSLAMNVLSSTTFATMLFTLYRGLACDEGSEPRIPAADHLGARGKSMFTGRRILLLGVLGLVIAFATGVFALQTVRLEDNVKVMAHRGASEAAPENTLASIRKAIEDGADWVEIDVQETADGEVVVFHDSDFMRMANRPLKIWDATMEDLKEIDIGSWFAPQFHAERVPTLAQVLDECRGKIGVNIELKYYGHDQQLEQRVAEIVDAHGMAADIVAMSLKSEAVRKMKRIRPDWKVGFLMSVSAGDLSQVEADFLAVNAGFANRRLVRTAHKNGKEIYVWTVNDGPTMSRMSSRGVDALLTDKPALARTVLEQRAQMSVPERLLLELAPLFGEAVEINAQ